MSNARKLRERPFRAISRRVWVVTNYGVGVRGIGTTRHDAMRDALREESLHGVFPDYYEVRQMTLVDGWKP